MFSFWELETIIFFYFKFPDQTKRSAVCLLACLIHVTIKVWEELACVPHASPLWAAQIPLLLSLPIRRQVLSMHARSHLHLLEKIPFCWDFHLVTLPTPRMKSSLTVVPSKPWSQIGPIMCFFHWLLVKSSFQWKIIILTCMFLKSNLIKSSSELQRPCIFWEMSKTLAK